MKSLFLNIIKEVILGSILLNLILLILLTGNINAYNWFFSGEAYEETLKIFLFTFISIILGFVPEKLGELTTNLYKLLFPKYKITPLNKNIIISSERVIRFHWWYIFTFGTAFWEAYKQKRTNMFIDQTKIRVMDSSKQIKLTVCHEYFWSVENFIHSITTLIILFCVYTFTFELIISINYWYIFLNILLVFLLTNFLFLIKVLILNIISRTINLDTSVTLNFITRKPAEIRKKVLELNNLENKYKREINSTRVKSRTLNLSKELDEFATAEINLSSGKDKKSRK